MMKVYTIEQLSRMLQVAPRTVAKWVDSGKLEGYRVPSNGSVHNGVRRVLKDALIRFLRKESLLDLLHSLTAQDRVVVYGVDQNVIRALKEVLGELKEIKVVQSVFSLGIEMQQAPALMVMSTAGMGEDEAKEIVEAYSSNGSSVVVLLNEDCSWHCVGSMPGVVELVQPVNAEQLKEHLRGVFLTMEDPTVSLSTKSKKADRKGS